MHRHTRVLALSLSCLVSSPAFAWDYFGHHLVNQVALAALPEDFPAFIRDPANAERVAFLAGEPDRWRNTPEEVLAQANGVDHFLDTEQVTDAGLDLHTISDFRYDFAAAFAAGRAAHIERFPAVDPKDDGDHTREWAGFLPYAITENFAKLRSEFSYWKELQATGTPAEVANAQANILYTMGVMGHFVGDSAQPLHVTKHHHGWVGANPNGYQTGSFIHAWIDGGYIAKVGIHFDELKPRIVTAQPLSIAKREDGRDPIFVASMDFILAQWEQVEPLYRLEKAGKFKGDDLSPTAEGRVFIDGQLLKGGEQLAALWITAWHQAYPDKFLHSENVKRNAHLTLEQLPLEPLPKPKKEATP